MFLDVLYCMYLLHGSDFPVHSVDALIHPSLPLADLCMPRVEMPHCAEGIYKKKGHYTNEYNRRKKAKQILQFFSNLTLQNNYNTLKHQSRIINLETKKLLTIKL